MSRLKKKKIKTLCGGLKSKQKKISITILFLYNFIRNKTKKHAYRII